MKHCTNCGFDIKSSESVCPHCGYQFSVFATETYNSSSDVKTNIAIAGFILSMFTGLFGLIVTIIAVKKGEMKKSLNKVLIILSFIFSITRMTITLLMLVITIIFGNVKINTELNTPDDSKCKYVYTCTEKTNVHGKYVCLYKSTSTSDSVVYCTKRYDIDKEN